MRTSRKKNLELRTTGRGFVIGISARKAKPLHSPGPAVCRHTAERCNPPGGVSVKIHPRIPQSNSFEQIPRARDPRTPALLLLHLESKRKEDEAWAARGEPELSQKPLDSRSHPQGGKGGKCTTAGTAGEQTARAEGRESRQKAIKRSNYRSTCVKSLPRELTQHLGLQLGNGARG